MPPLFLDQRTEPFLVVDMIRGRPVLRPRIDESSHERLYLTKINTHDSLGLTGIYFVLNSDIENDLTFAVQSDGWAADLTCAESLHTVW